MGTCVECSNASPNEYYVAQAGSAPPLLENSCSVASCAALPACATGQYRTGCFGASQGLCIACTNKGASGYYTSDGGLEDSCLTAECANLTCAAGSYRTGDCGNQDGGTNNDYACLPCRRGSFSGALDASEQCEPCPAGQYQKDGGKTACDTCPEGRYCEEGSSTPLLCAAGSYRRTTGATSQGGDNGCDTCPAGSACPAGSTDKTPCDEGTFTSAPAQAALLVTLG